MRLQDRALASARVAIANEKASEELKVLLEKWFAKHLVKGVKLPMLRNIHDAGAFAAFADCLATHNEADVIAILRKLDPHRAEILARPRSEMEDHIRSLASGRLEPAGKPKPPKNVKSPKAAKPVRNGGVYERSRL
jgi:hypothetical protein